MHTERTWQSERLTVHAIVDIPSGAEIFVNYRCKDFFKIIPDRKVELRRHYHFICNCIACQPMTPFGFASAVRRDQIRVLKEYNNEPRHRYPTITDERNKQLANIKLIVFLLHQEGLWYPQLADYLHEEIMWYRREMEFAQAADEVEGYKYIVALRREALQVARQKLEWDVRCNGYESPEVANTLELIGDLRDG